MGATKTYSQSTVTVNPRSKLQNVVFQWIGRGLTVDWPYKPWIDRTNRGLTVPTVDWPYDRGLTVWPWIDRMTVDWPYDDGLTVSWLWIDRMIVDWPWNDRINVDWPYKPRIDRTNRGLNVWPSIDRMTVDWQHDGELTVDWPYDRGLTVW